MFYIGTLLNTIVSTRCTEATPFTGHHTLSYHSTQGKYVTEEMKADNT